MWYIVGNQDNTTAVNSHTPVLLHNVKHLFELWGCVFLCVNPLTEEWNLTPAKEKTWEKGHGCWIREQTQTF